MENRKMKIVTDSGCDLPKECLEKAGVACIRLGFLLSGVEYHGDCGEEISPSDFYDKMRAGALPTTYQVSPESAKSCMERCLEEGFDVLAVTFSSGLSGTANSFLIAKKELAEQYPERKIFVVDSLCASLGQGLLLHYVLKKADEGAPIEEVYEYAQGLKMSVSHQFTVNDLFHLKRGGRVSSATALVGTMMNIKPILHVNDEGKLIPIGKVMGRKKSLHRLFEILLETNELEEEDPIYISHADCLADAEFLKETIEKSFPKNPVFISYIGPVIGAHAGCGTVALFFKAKMR